MENRIAVISIIVEDSEAAPKLNELLHKYGDGIIGRMGIPHREKGVNIICIAMDAPLNDINALAGELGRIEGLTAKATYSSK